MRRSRQERRKNGIVQKRIDRGRSEIHVELKRKMKSRRGWE